MKRFFKIVMLLTLPIVLALAIMGVVNYIDIGDNGISDSVSADMVDLQDRMSNLYLAKFDYEEEKAEIEDRLSEAEDNQQISEAEINALGQRLIEIDTEISKINKKIEELETALSDIYELINTQNRSVITLCLAQQFNVEGNYSVIPLSVYCSFGDKLSFTNNGVSINEGVSKVLVSANVFVGANGEVGSRDIVVLKNNNNAVHSGLIIAPGTSSNIVLSPILMNVNAGDYINLKYETVSTTDSIWGNSEYVLTYMTIEVVA